MKSKKGNKEETKTPVKVPALMDQTLLTDIRKDQTLPVQSEILLYQTEDGQTRIEVPLQDETVWMTQAAMAELYQTTAQNITTHLKAIFKEGELDESATCKEYLQVQKEGARRVSRNRKVYNLPAIIAVGYRVRSHRGTQFRARI